MSYMRGDLLTRTRKLVKGLAKPTPVWLKAMEEAPPVVFPRTDGKIKKIELPEDVYVKRFFNKHPNSLYHDAIRISGFDLPPARVFAWRVLKLKAQGVSEMEAMAVADMEYRAEKKAKKAAYKELKEISSRLGKTPPPNPYPVAIKEIQEEEDVLVHERWNNPKILELVQNMREEKAAEAKQQGGDSQRGQWNQRGDTQRGQWNQRGGWRGDQQQGGDAQRGQWNQRGGWRDDQQQGSDAQRGQWNQRGGWRGDRPGGQYY